MTQFEVLKQYFGYDSFREGQEYIIENILAGRDCLGVMPTGAGKSICFQVPAILLSGITLVVSPLISLMQDQVTSLIQSGIPAAFINSSLTERQIFKALELAKNGKYKLIYVAPERLLTSGFLSFAQNVRISMVTVDEAHCISQWGQDFRPSYSKIPEFVAALSNRPIVSAFTATATPLVREDIVNSLQLCTPATLVTGFNRKNLYFEVQKPKNKISALESFLQTHREKNGIVYCSTRNNVEEVCQKLLESGYSAARYHAGLSDGERKQNQEDFLYDRVQIMVATNAFGMGIDKSNVSFVVHYNMPKDIESYYQEAGRAGRDGEPADCVLLYSGQDVRTALWMIDNNHDMQYADHEMEALLKERDRKRLREMTFYCATQDCLRAYILNYFGETPPNYCGNCSNCNSNFESVDITVEAQKILSCVCRMQERYGVTMVIDVLRGSKSERVLHLGLQTLPTYGICELSDKKLREIVNFLLLQGYLKKTDDQYPILQLDVRANDILQKKQKITMKLAIETQKEKVSKKPLGTMDNNLYAALRVLRKKIAEEQGVPAFVIFSDHTLTDMCMKKPRTERELLEVSGIGQVKLERYGWRFLKIIADYLQNNPHAAEATEKKQTPIDSSGYVAEDNPVLVSRIADQISSILLQSGEPKISAAKINEWLVYKGYLETTDFENKSYKTVTPAGEALGITTIEKQGRISRYKTNFYNQSAQYSIAEHIREILQFVKEQ